MTAVITAMGAVTSVGRSVPSACAALRARITRPRKLGHFRVVDEENQEEVGLMAHPLKGYTEGFNLVGRWLRLAHGCMEDLLEAPGAPSPVDARFWARTGLVGVLPAPGSLLPGDEDEAGPLLNLTLRPFREELGLAVPDSSLEVVALGHAGLAFALERGLRLLASGRVCFLLEREAEARRREATPLARVTASVTGQETSAQPERRYFPGIALAGCAREALERSSARMPFNGDFYVDLNGEPWRSRLWGGALTRLRPHLEDPGVHLVASSVGDTGSASAALGLCLAAYELAWGHARSRLSLVTSTSDDGAVGCVAVQGMEGPVRSPLFRKEALR